MRYQIPLTWLSLVLLTLGLSACLRATAGAGPVGDGAGNAGAYDVPLAQSAAPYVPTDEPPATALTSSPPSNRDPELGEGSGVPPTLIPIPAGYLEGASRETSVARAQTELRSEGLVFSVIVVSFTSEGLRYEIYQDLIRRNFRATTGPDEGIDTTPFECYPDCVFIRQDAVDALPVESWKNVLRHEQRHMVQAANHPALAQAFRQTDSLFTTYAAFLEACADDGIFVAENMYHASERMPMLREVLGAPNTYTLAQACQGKPPAYTEIVHLYENRVGVPGAFAQLFPPYR